MTGPITSTPCPIEFCVVYVGDLSRHLALHHNFEITDIKKIVKLITFRPYEKVRVQKCPETGCLMTALEGTFQEHLQHYHGYSISQSAIIRLALDAVPVIPPTLTIDDSSDDDDDLPPVLKPIKEVNLKAALDVILKEDDAMTDVESKNMNNNCKSPEAEEIPSLGSCGDTEDDDMVILKGEEEEAVVLEKEEEDEEKKEKLPKSDSEMTDFISFNACGSEIIVYPIIQDVVNFLEENRSGVRFEKKLTAKEIKKLISGELSFEEFKQIKFEHDRIKGETFGSVGSSQREIKNERESVSGDDDIPSVSSSKRGGNKFGRREKKPVEVNRCRLCNSYRLRVVDYGRTDGKNILECANRKCLATICLTEKPAGTMIEVPVTSDKNHGWFLDSTMKMRYPDLDALASGDLTADPDISVPPELEEEAAPVKTLHCPGQSSLVRII